eukprot:10793172-Alexandrium_andersonii.AAC.1
MVPHGRSESDLDGRAAGRKVAHDCEPASRRERPGQRGDAPHGRQGNRRGQAGTRGLAPPTGEEHRLSVL